MNSPSECLELDICHVEYDPIFNSQEQPHHAAFYGHALCTGCFSEWPLIIKDKNKHSSERGPLKSVIQRKLQASSKPLLDSPRELKRGTTNIYATIYRSLNVMLIFINPSYLYTISFFAICCHKQCWLILRFLKSIQNHLAGLKRSVPPPQT